MSVDIDVREQQKIEFSLKETLLWIMDPYFDQKWQFKVKTWWTMMDLFLTNTQFFTSQNVNWWTAVMWITCELLWCFYQLFELILTAPIHSRGFINELNFSKSVLIKKQIHLQWCEKVFAPFLIFHFFACLSHFNVSDHQTNLNLNQR